jgi:hypothetical protein
MPNAREAKVLEAIDSIKEFHELGRSLPKKGEPKDAYGQGTMAMEAVTHGMNEDTIRKARQFADPEVGYTLVEVNALCKLIQTVQSEEDRSIFRRTHLIRMLTVPKKERNKIQKLAVEAGWSSKELERQIASRFGSRRDGGRKRQAPKDLLGVLTQLEGLCESWQRWVNALDENNNDAQRRSGREQSLLPVGLNRSFAKATRAILTLHDEVNSELQTLRPRRGVRGRFRVEDASTE